MIKNPTKKFLQPQKDGRSWKWLMSQGHLEQGFVPAPSPSPLGGPVNRGEMSDDVYLLLSSGYEPELHMCYFISSV